RKPYPNPLPSYLKLSANFYSTYSYREAKQKGFDEALLLTTNELITEGSYCNLFWIYKNECFTPSLSSSILEGITRSKIIEASIIEHIPIQEGEFPLSLLERANSIFISSSTRGLIPVTRLNEKVFPIVTYEKVERIKARYEIMLQESLKKW
ncbi:MAG: aminotransferase class IV, partial [Leptospiraceae bacterium]|nr:aminotransferase class IV [Leptospiraceae bacterium]